ncbi:hypothetical protein PTSG_04864 [Salpingoeca rosetta]|uniref:Uncharacterized protein n=1 Tax=Salpingoeca rosetta (strain ATCC 50818 / BSB-021) TaxID=946362 RepID=F2U8U9_SALR5|nr:uncharacterized protein PTSG_04864 [Salpingoeca rosetta]EGD73152.1 hypothetical protein PTSG_04864 [Salpingoeca rosetta]|eukprot:XP_004994183.1 hypothetical protein PTSG_04864 [Salpingoeca rosetta]
MAVVAVEEIFVLLVAAGITVLLFGVMLSIRQKARVNSLDPRGAIDPQLRNAMPTWMQQAVSQHLEDSIQTRILARRVIRDKDLSSARDDLTTLKNMERS